MSYSILLKTIYNHSSTTLEAILLPNNSKHIFWWWLLIQKKYTKNLHKIGRDKEWASKREESTGRLCMRGGLLKFELKKSIFINGTVQYLMFILASSIFEFFTGELERITWWTFEFWSWLTQSLLYNVHSVHQDKFKKSKKAKHVDLPFFIKKVGMIADLVISGL